MPKRVKRKGTQNLAGKLENGVIRGLVLAGDVVFQRAQRKAPVDTGRLKRSIHRGDPIGISPTLYTIKVGTNVEYAKAQEFGSDIHGVRAQPYLRPALDESRGDIRVILINSIVGSV